MENDVIEGGGSERENEYGCVGHGGEPIQQVTRELENPPGAEHGQHPSGLALLGLSMSIQKSLATVENLNLPPGLQRWLLLENHYCA